MKRTTTVTLLVFSATLFLAISQASAQILTDLQILYEFDTVGSPGINSASGNPGTPGNLSVTTAEARAGAGSADFGTLEAIPNKAYLTVNDLDVAAASPGAEGQFSFSFWWKPTTDETTAPGKQQSFWAAHNTADQPANFPPFSELALSYYQSTRIFNLFREEGLAAGADSSDGVDSLPNFFDGGWHHVAEVLEVSASGNLKRFTRYLDGQLTSVGSNDTDGWDMQKMILGHQSDDILGSPSSQDLDGFLDDFAMWTRGLNTQEVSEIYNAGLQGIGIADIPEPSSMLLALLGLVGLAGYRWRRRVGIRS